jgi:hypothetical protein
MFEEMPPCQEGHFRGRFKEVCEELTVNYRGELFLVAAGFLGKFYCDLIKSRGGIAIDVGSIVDYWLGHDTRGAEMYNEFSKDYSEHYEPILRNDSRLRGIFGAN